MGIPVLSIAFDSIEEQAAARDELAIDGRWMLSDPDGSVSKAYGVLEWAVPSGEPGHTFVLVDGRGDVAWLQDFGAEESGGRMYVPIPELVTAIQGALGQ